MIVGSTGREKVQSLDNLYFIRRLCFLNRNRIESYTVTTCGKKYMKLFPSVIFQSGLPTKEELTEMICKNNDHCLIFFDDIIHDIINNIDIERLITGYAHHYRVTLCIMTQNLYYHGRHSKMMTLNHGSFILMPSRTDTSQICNFGRQVMGPGKGAKAFWLAYEDTQNKNYGYLFVDVSPSGKKAHMLRTFIFPDEGPILIYGVKL